MVNVYDTIKPLLTFDSSDDFYYLQIMQRKKDHSDLKSNSRIIKNYFINSIEYLDAHMNEIIKMCDLFNARAGLRLNKRSYKKVAFKTIQIIAGSLVNEEFLSVRKAYSRACGVGYNDKNKKWILDIDNVEINAPIIKDISDLIEEETIGKIYFTLPTKSGVHIITSPFDQRILKNQYDIDIHKDNPINLYIP